MKNALPLTSMAISTPLGDMLLATSDRGLAGLWFLGQKHFPDIRHFSTLGPGDTSARAQLLHRASEQVQAYLQAQRESFDLPLDLSCGTTFQQSVWHALLGIARGQTWGYGQLARHLRNPQAVRAVGAAVGRNPIGIIVPCHRVVGANGALTGYAGDLDRKAALLALEHAAMGSLC